MNKKATAVSASVLLLLLAFAAVGHFWENYEAFYYCEVPEQAEYKELGSNSDLPYEYTLTCYNEKGAEKKLTFKTGNLLEAGICLKIEVRFTGVYHYDIIQFDRMPNSVQQLYASAWGPVKFLSPVIRKA